MLVQGIHHVCIRCEKNEIEKVKEFYQGVLGMPVIRSWGEPELAGFMFDTGAGLVEVFTDAEGVLPQGSIRHFALKTDDVDGCVKAVREAGYPITVEPKDVVIPSQPEFPVRVAFCNGPVKTMKYTTEEEAMEIRTKKEEIKRKRRARKKGEK